MYAYILAYVYYMNVCVMYTYILAIWQIDDSSSNLYGPQACIYN